MSKSKSLCKCEAAARELIQLWLDGDACIRTGPEDNAEAEASLWVELVARALATINPPDNDPYVAFPALRIHPPNIPCDIDPARLGEELKKAYHVTRARNGWVQLLGTLGISQEQFQEQYEQYPKEIDPGSGGWPVLEQLDLTSKGRG